MREIKDEKGHSVQAMGRAGILFKNGIDEYFIDSELLVGPKYDLVIYSKNIRFWDESNKTPISKENKKQIVSLVVKLFESEGTKVELL